LHQAGERAFPQFVFLHYRSMSARVIFVTGTDTGVGKTVLAALLVRQLVSAGIRVAAFKPVSSGSREDAQALRRELNGALSLDEINPWHFRQPIAPVLAARQERRRVRLAQVVSYLKRAIDGYEVAVVEGAGGLLSPLGEDFSSRELLVALRATPVIACPNRLGAVNQARLTLDALPKRERDLAHVFLVSPQKAEGAAKSNQKLLAEFLEAPRIHLLPWLGEKRKKADWPVRKTLIQIISQFERTQRSRTS
jgi:dethiobiotin synthetase